EEAALVEEGAVGAEGRFDDEVAADRVTPVEAGIALLRAEVQVVLRDRAASASASNRRGVIDGVREGVGSLQRDALVHALAQIDGERVGALEAQRILVTEYARGR